MSAKDDAYDRLRRVLKTLAIEVKEGKFVPGYEKDKFIESLQKACKVFLASCATATKKRVVFEVLRDFTKRAASKGYDCAKMIAERIAQASASDSFAKMIEEPFAKYFSPDSISYFITISGFYIRHDKIDAFAGAVVDVVFAKDAPIAHDLDMFVFYKLRDSRKQNDDDFAQAIVEAIEKTYRMYRTT